MATEGVPYNPPDNIEDIFKKHQGVLLHIAKELNIARSTLYAHINKHPHLVELVAELRRGFVRTGLDIAENVVYKKMLNDESGEQLKAAMFFLNNQGGELGYVTNKQTAQLVCTLSELARAAQKGELSQKHNEKDTPTVDR